MGIDIYGLGISAPCRAVMLTAKAVDVDYNFKKVDLFEGEHKKPEFLKINPQHTVPTIDDQGFYLWESRAIMGYLVNQYGKDNSLYPEDPKKRAVVDQRLYFDMGTLYESFGKYAYPIMFEGVKSGPEKLDKLKESMQFLEGFLKNSKYAAGETLTIADHSLVATVSTIEATGIIDLESYPAVSLWLTTCKSEMEGYQEVNDEGAIQFGSLFKSTAKSQGME